MFNCEKCTFSTKNIGVYFKHKKYFCKNDENTKILYNRYKLCKYCNMSFRVSSLHQHEIACYLNPNAKNKDEFIFVENSTYTRTHLKNKILDRNLIKYECSICNIGPFWNNKNMPLILDHINGINNDNRLDNLRFVCSNCDTQLPTYKSKNRKK